MSENPMPMIPAKEIPWRELYPSHEAMALLGGISEPTFRRLTKSGALRTRKIRSRVYVQADDLRAYIDSLPSASDTQAA